LSTSSRLHSAPQLALPQAESKPVKTARILSSPDPSVLPTRKPRKRDRHTILHPAGWFVAEPSKCRPPAGSGPASRHGVAPPSGSQSDSRRRPVAHSQRRFTAILPDLCAAAGMGSALN
jgi:hypothetical protein